MSQIQQMQRNIAVRHHIKSYKPVGGNYASRPANLCEGSRNKGWNFQSKQSAKSWMFILEKVASQIRYWLARVSKRRARLQME